RGGLDETIAGDRSRDFGAVPADRCLVTPKNFARLRFDTHQTLLHKLHVLFDATNPDSNGGGVGRFVAARQGAFPDDRARVFVQSQTSGQAASRSATDPS